MEFIDEKLLDYCQDHSSPESDLLKQLSRDTRAKVLNPRMLSGHLQGRFLSMISRMLQPERILEIGTYTGYSALCLCEGLKNDGLLITIDINDELESLSLSYFAASVYANRIHQKSGDTLQIIPTLQDTFDLVFIDADKKEYLEYYQLIIDKVRPGGIILADNVLWSGHVIKSSDKADAETSGITRFNEAIAADPRVDVCMLPVRDGLSIIRKKRGE